MQRDPRNGHGSTCAHGFNPHPAFRPGATEPPGTTQRPAEVSILTRPFDRVQPHEYNLCRITLTRFNPHPAFRPGATLRPVRPSGRSWSFNPHPAFRPGATDYEQYHDPPGAVFQSSPGLSTGCNRLRAVSRSTWCSVSILTRPFDRVQPGGADLNVEERQVSILTRPFDRVQRVEIVCLPRDPYEVSILTRPFDRVQRRLRRRCKTGRYRFQSSPGLSTGCNLVPFTGKVLRSPGFNPHPAFRPGATGGRLLGGVRQHEFQSSPGLSTGCNIASPTLRGSTSLSFNPHPAFRPGVTCPSTQRMQRMPKKTFQSSPGLSTGCNTSPVLARHRSEQEVVSILTRPFDRV